MASIVTKKVKGGYYYYIQSYHEGKQHTIYGGKTIALATAKIKNLGLPDNTGIRGKTLLKRKGKRASSKLRPNNHGYLLSRVGPESPYYPMVSIQKQRKGYTGSCTTHRLVMAKHLGRPLESWEIVHHKNHVKTDNRIENLELISKAIEHNAETLTHVHFMKMKKRIEELEAQLG